MDGRVGESCTLLSAFIYIRFGVRRDFLAVYREERKVELEYTKLNGRAEDVEVALDLRCTS